MIIKNIFEIDECVMLNNKQVRILDYKYSTCFGWLYTVITTNNKKGVVHELDLIKIL
jgi:hypothetical protein